MPLPPVTVIEPKYHFYFCNSLWANGARARHIHNYVCTYLNMGLMHIVYLYLVMFVYAFSFINII